MFVPLRLSIYFYTNLAFSIVNIMILKTNPLTIVEALSIVPSKPTIITFEETNEFVSVSELSKVPLISFF